MKNRIRRMLVAVVSACLMIVEFSGCTLFNKNLTPQQRAAELYQLSSSASAFGVGEYLKFNPNDGPKFDLAWTNLDLALANGALSGAALHSIVYSLPIKELKSPEATLAFDGALFLYTTLTAGNVNVESNLIYVVATGRGVHDGIGRVRGLGTQLGPP